MGRFIKLQAAGRIGCERARRDHDGDRREASEVGRRDRGSGDPADHTGYGVQRRGRGEDDGRKLHGGDDDGDFSGTADVPLQVPRQHMHDREHERPGR